MAVEWAWMQQAFTVMLNLAVAVAVGASMSAIWMARGGARWAVAPRRRLRLAGLAALAVAMLASAGVLWLEAAAMAEVAPAQAAPAVRAMLTATHLGVAWQVGIGALLFSMGALALRGPRALAFNLLGLAAFLYTRSMVSHAAADGDFSVPIAVDWLHLMLVCLWTGEVAVAGWLVRLDDGDWTRYAAALSHTATLALGGIVATGLFGAWRNVGSPAALTGQVYGTILLAKLALVAIAVLLGGANRFFVMPSLRGDNACAAARRFTAILRIESVVLLGVLVLAAVLSATAPPTAL
ncbi:MAG: CopD family protein [Pseudomonadota bacterium]|nr:CopD family protein [Pseudomonadota bacterium]